MAMFIADKSKRFAIRIIRFCHFLTENGLALTLSRQLLRSGTAIGANVAEAANAQSDRDFLSKISIALKECSETKYWLEVFVESGTTEERHFTSLYEDCVEIEKLLTRTVKATKIKIEDTSSSL